MPAAEHFGEPTAAPRLLSAFAAAPTSFHGASLRCIASARS
jgi:hypothetical protein